MNTTHPNRNWRKRWTVDLLTHTARHDSGFAVRINPLNTGEWECVEIEEAAGVAEVPDLIVRDVDDYPDRKQRLMDEAVNQYRVVFEKHNRIAR
jgi:hypothetical protein